MIHTYQIGTNEKGQQNITCLMCGLTSYHPEDIRHRYCGHCHMDHNLVMRTLALVWDHDPGVSRVMRAHLMEILQAMPEDSRAGLEKLIPKQSRTIWQRLLDEFDLLCQRP